MAIEPLIDLLRTRYDNTPIYETLGIEIVRLKPRDVLLAFDCRELHANLDGWLHGGIAELVADTAMGFAARLEAAPGSVNRTLHVAIDFQHGARLGDRVECAATMSHRTRQFGWTRCELRRVADGTPVASGTGLQMLAAAK